MVAVVISSAYSTVLSLRSIGMTRFLNILNKGRQIAWYACQACQHLHTQYHHVFHLSRTGTYRHTRLGEVAPRHSVYRLEKFLSKIQPTSRSLYKPSQRSSYMSIYQGAVIRTLERLSDVSDGLSTITGLSSYDTIS